MDRRRCLQSAAVATASGYLPGGGRPARIRQIDIFEALATSLIPKAAVDVADHTLICEFKLDATEWKVYEALRTRDGGITFLSAAGARVLGKGAEAGFVEAVAPYLGLSPKDIGMSGRDLLADRLLEDGDDPDPERVRLAAPPLGSTQRTGPSLATALGHLCRDQRMF